MTAWGRREAGIWGCPQGLQKGILGCPGGFRGPREGLGGVRGGD